MIFLLYDINLKDGIITIVESKTRRFWALNLEAKQSVLLINFTAHRSEVVLLKGDISNQLYKIKIVLGKLTLKPMNIK